MTFTMQQPVRFAHVDAAGIVFYPRYFEMINAAVEDYFADAVGVGFAEMHRDRLLGVPTVKLETVFIAPSRLGDILDITIEVGKVGGSSAELQISIASGGEDRLHATVVIVCMNLVTNRSSPWPVDMRPEARVESCATLGSGPIDLR